MQKRNKKPKVKEETRRDSIAWDDKETSQKKPKEKRRVSCCGLSLREKLHSFLFINLSSLN